MLPADYQAVAQSASESRNGSSSFLGRDDADSTAGSIDSVVVFLSGFSLAPVHLYGIRKRDKTIYIACVGWILLDAAIVVGVLVRG